MDTPNALTHMQAEAQQAYQAGDYLRAADVYRHAADAFSAQGDALSAAEMRNNQSVALLRSGDAQSALKVCEGTDLIFAQAFDLRRQAIALGNQAAALEGLGRWKIAIEKYERAAELLDKTGDKELKDITYQSLSALQLKHNRHIDALTSMQSSLASKDHLSVKENILRRLIRTAFQLIQRPPLT